MIDFDFLKKKLSAVKLGSADYISRYNTWAINLDGVKGFALEAKDSTQINESFVKIKVYSDDFNIGKAHHHLIVLCTKDNCLDDVFYSVVGSFLDDNNRDTIANEPQKWYLKWKNSLGNSKTNKTVYDVIGEMRLLVELFKKGETPVWKSLTSGTFDIYTEHGFYEVKSSVVKTESNITIHSLKQLLTSMLDKPLYIAYCQIEDTGSGDSIQSLFDELVKLGMNVEELDEYLIKSGYYPKSIDREKRYLVEEIRLYLVDDSFPKITEDSFIDKNVLSSVIGLEYTLSLKGLKYNKLF